MIGDMIKKRCPECRLTAFIVPSITIATENAPAGMAQCLQGHKAFRFEHSDMFADPPRSNKDMS